MHACTVVVLQHVHCMQALQTHGAQVTLTDRAVQIPLLKRNIAENFGASASASACAFLVPRMCMRDNRCAAGPRDKQPSVVELDWASDLACHPAGPGFAAYDIIVGSDVAYDGDLFQPLLDTITAFTTRKPSTQACC